MFASILFFIFSFLILASALLVITSKNPVNSVIFLIFSFFNAAGIFLIAGAEFLALIMLIVYVGAVAVLFLFVVMMLDINLGADSSNPSKFTVLNDDQIIFTANDGSKGTELWMVTLSSGTVALVKDIDTRTDSYGTPYSSNPYEFTLFNDELYFRANDADHGTELWKTDGTEDGTVLVKDIDPREYSSGSKYSGNPYWLTVMGDSLYFAAYDSSGNELWKSDGTRIGTTRIADIREGESGSNPAEFTVLGDYMYFRADDGESGTELWKTSGTGASLLKDIFPGESNGYPNSSYPINLYVFNNHILFSAQGVNGTELWKTDGTEDGTYMVKDIHPGNSTSGYPLSSSPSSFVTVGDTMYFTATGQFGKELYSSDGSTTGTQLVEDFNYGSADGLSCTSYDCYYNDYGGSLFALDDYLLFSAQDGYFGYELYFNQLRETNVYYN